MLADVPPTPIMRVIISRVGWKGTKAQIKNGLSMCRDR